MGFYGPFFVISWMHRGWMSGGVIRQWCFEKLSTILSCHALQTASQTASQTVLEPYLTSIRWSNQSTSLYRDSTPVQSPQLVLLVQCVHRTTKFKLKTKKAKTLKGFNWYSLPSARKLSTSEKSSHTRVESIPGSRGFQPPLQNYFLLAPLCQCARGKNLSWGCSTCLELCREFEFFFCADS